MKNFLSKITAFALFAAAATILYPVEAQVPAIHSGLKTYTAVTANFTPAATPTDLCLISGTGGTVRVLDARIGGTATALAVVDVFLVKRGTANTAGTFVAATVVPHDVVDTSGAPVVGHYTANPTINNTIGTVAHRKVTLPIATSAVANVNEKLLPDLITFGGVKPIYLRGTAAQLAVNFAGAALPAGAANWFCSFTWIEE